MAILKTYDVDCDFDGCLEWTYGDVGHRVTVNEARYRARESGWVYKDGKDLCPEHK